MLNSKIHPIWHALGPKEWPTPPATMSFSKLFEIEACPRRWALSSARYPEIWGGLGYPEKFRLSTNIGRIVHLALKRITEALAGVGCVSLMDASAIAVLKDLGGYTKIINECIQSILVRFQNNPRVSKKEEMIAQAIRSKAPEIRERVQIILSKMQLMRRHERQTSKGLSDEGRSPLGFGSYPEVYLSDDKLGWAGVADLINISESECEIIDFKTGEPQTEHPFQLQIYSLLWALDSEVNPSARPASKLTLFYRNGEVDVPVLTPAELRILKDGLSERTRSSVLAVSIYPPEVRPSLQTCSHCEIRQLCEDYWSTSVQRCLAQEVPEKSEFGDLELTITSLHGPSSWNAVVEVYRDAEGGRPLLLRTSRDGPELHIGDRIRVLDGHLAEVIYDESETLLLTITSGSEIFFVPK